MKNDRRNSERRSWSVKKGGVGSDLAKRVYIERRKTIIKAGRRTGLVGEYYSKTDPVWGTSWTELFFPPITDGEYSGDIDD